MRPFSESIFNDCPERFQRISHSLIIPVDDIANLLRVEIPVSTVDFADHLSGRQQLNRKKLVRTKSVFQMFPSVFPGNIRIPFKLIILKLRKKLKQIIVVCFKEWPEQKPLIFSLSVPTISPWTRIVG